MERARFSWVAVQVAWVLCLTACGVEGRQAEKPAATAPQAAAAAEFQWPEGPREFAVLEIAGHGEIRIALYPELAPRNVANFRRLAMDGFYAGTTFHRVIPGFMIQGGDPNTRNDDPADDGQGGPGYTVPDEFSPALHLRGTVSMANTGYPNSGGSQFFIVHKGNPGLDRHFSVIGRVVEGMDIVDAITRLELDTFGRWGPKDRPIEDVVVERVRIERVTDSASERSGANRRRRSSQALAQLPGRSGSGQ